MLHALVPAIKNGQCIKPYVTYETKFNSNRIDFLLVLIRRELDEIVSSLIHSHTCGKSKNVKKSLLQSDKRWVEGNIKINSSL